MGPWRMVLILAVKFVLSSFKKGQGAAWVTIMYPGPSRKFVYYWQDGHLREGPFVILFSQGLNPKAKFWFSLNDCSQPECVFCGLLSSGCTTCFTYSATWIFPFLKRIPVHIIMNSWRMADDFPRGIRTLEYLLLEEVKIDTALKGSKFWEICQLSLGYSCDTSDSIREKIK